MRETNAFLVGPHYNVLAELRREFIASRKPVLVEKTPGHVNHLAIIRRFAPGARFIITVRDGRDVVASLIRRFDGDTAKALRMWVNNTETSITASHYEDVLLVRYEDFVENPQRVATSICQFIGVQFDAAMIEYHQSPVSFNGHDGQAKTDGRGSSHGPLRAWQVNQPVFDGRGRWKSDLPQNIVPQFYRGSAGELMRDLGYIDVETA